MSHCRRSCRNNKMYDLANDGGECALSVSKASHVLMYPVNLRPVSHNVMLYSRETKCARQLFLFCREDFMEDACLRCTICSGRS